MKMKYAKSDFTKDDLPLTRKKQFFAIFKNEWKTLLLLGAIFLIPFVLFLGLEAIRWNLFANAVSAAQSSGDNASLSALTYTIEIVYNALLIIVYVGFAFVFSGASRVIQRLIYGEGLLFGGDFWYGVKHNFKHLLIYSIIFGIGKFLVSFASITLGLNGGQIEIILAGILEAIFSFIIVPILFFACSFSVTYKMKIKEEIGNGFKIFFATLIVPILFAGILFAFKYVDLYYINTIIVIPIIQLAAIFILLPILFLIWQLYVTSICDKYINENAYPIIYKKGLRDYNYKGDK